MPCHDINGIVLPCPSARNTEISPGMSESRSRMSPPLMIYYPKRKLLQQILTKHRILKSIGKKSPAKGGQNKYVSSKNRAENDQAMKKDKITGNGYTMENQSFKQLVKKRNPRYKMQGRNFFSVL